MKITKDDITLEPIKQWAHSQKAFLLNSRHNFSYGFIRKFHEDRYTKTPWQAFRGIGQGTQLIGSFYGPTGKEDAINAILKQL